MPRRYPGQFTARFDSRCPGCDDSIHEGDDAVMLDGVAHCTGCAEEEYPGYLRNPSGNRGVSADWS